MSVEFEVKVVVTDVGGDRLTVQSQKFGDDETGVGIDIADGSVILTWDDVRRFRDALSTLLDSETGPPFP